MGQFFDVKCNNCENHWEHFEGSGFRMEAYHCNKCGKRNDYMIFDSCPDLWELRNLCLDKWKTTNDKEEKLLLENHFNTIDKKIKKHKRKTIDFCDCGGKNELYVDKIICPDCQSKDKSQTGDNWIWD